MTKQTRFSVLFGGVATGCLLTLFPASGVAQTTDREALVATLDSIARAHVENEMVPGVAISIVKDGVTLLEQGYGYVDLEWGIPTPADASFEIGSVTKQFTSASVMLLVEEGKLDLDADFTEYIDFDTKGRTIPLRRLLDHTSGIKGYTEMPVFGELTPRKLPRDTLVRILENEPVHFEPGTAHIYNNSAYFLLGLVIEAVSDMTYEDFVAERIFEPLGMTDSYYCSERAIRPNRAHGYDAAGPGQLIRARYLDHTWPYAAGSLCSTVGDLVRWNQALHGGEVLSESSYEAMTTPMPLEDGWPTTYAMGLGIGMRGDTRMISHGGGINGFLSDGKYFPDEELIVVVLQNSTGASPGVLANFLIREILGEVEAPEPVVATYSGSLDEFVGEYVGAARGPDMTMTITVEDGALAVSARGGPAAKPAYQEGLTWKRGNSEMTFMREGGEVVGMTLLSGGVLRLSKAR